MREACIAIASSHDVEGVWQRASGCGAAKALLVGCDGLVGQVC